MRTDRGRVRCGRPLALAGRSRCRGPDMVLLDALANDGTSGGSARAAIPVDTTPMDLSKVQTSLPPSLPDTFKGPAQTARRSAGEVVRSRPFRLRHRR